MVAAEQIADSLPVEIGAVRQLQQCVRRAWYLSLVQRVYQVILILGDMLGCLVMKL